MGAPAGFEVVRRVRLPRDADATWAWVTTPAGIADELRPVLRMTVPPGLRAGIEGVRLGEPAGRSWILLGGLLPVEYDDLRLVALDERSFSERSKTLTLATWEHHRAVTAEGPDACVVADTLRGTPRALPGRVPGLVPVARGLVDRLFAHRHARLLRWARGSAPTHPAD